MFNNTFSVESEQKKNSDLVKLVNQLKDVKTRNSVEYSRMDLRSLICSLPFRELSPEIQKEILVVILQKRARDTIYRDFWGDLFKLKLPIEIMQNVLSTAIEKNILSLRDFDRYFYDAYHNSDKETTEKFLLELYVSALDKFDPADQNNVSFEIISKFSSDKRRIFVDIFLDHAFARDVFFDKVQFRKIPPDMIKEILLAAIERDADRVFQYLINHSFFDFEEYALPDEIKKEIYDAFLMKKNPAIIDSITSYANGMQHKECTSEYWEELDEIKEISEVRRNDPNRNVLVSKLKQQVNVLQATGEISCEKPLVSIGFRECGAFIIVNEDTGATLMMHLDDDCIRKIDDGKACFLNTDRYMKFMEETGRKSFVYVGGEMTFDRSGIIEQIRKDGAKMLPSIKVPSGKNAQYSNDQASHRWDIIYRPREDKLIVYCKNLPGKVLEYDSIFKLKKERNLTRASQFEEEMREYDKERKILYDAASTVISTFKDKKADIATKTNDLNNALKVMDFDKLSSIIQIRANSDIPRLLHRGDYLRKSDNTLQDDKLIIDAIHLILQNTSSDKERMHAIDSLLILVKGMVDYRRCELFLMQNQSYSSSIKESTKEELYLYKERMYGGNSRFYYRPKSAMYNSNVTDESALVALQSANFNSTKSNLLPCNDENVYYPVLANTSRNGHTNNIDQNYIQNHLKIVEESLKFTKEIFDTLPDTCKKSESYINIRDNIKLVEEAFQNYVEKIKPNKIISNEGQKPIENTPNIPNIQKPESTYESNKSVNTPTIHTPVAPIKSPLIQEMPRVSTIPDSLWHKADELNIKEVQNNFTPETINGLLDVNVSPTGNILLVFDEKSVSTQLERLKHINKGDTKTIAAFSIPANSIRILKNCDKETLESIFNALDKNVKEVSYKK